LALRSRDGRDHRSARQVRGAGRQGQHPAGVVIGYGLFGDTGGIDWIAFFISIVLAAVFVVIAATVTGRTKKA
jgi:hypothetical protein